MLHAAAFSLRKYWGIGSFIEFSRTSVPRVSKLMAGRHAAVVPRSRSRSPQAVARTDPGEMINQVRGLGGTIVASIEMHTHDRCHVLKHRISSVLHVVVIHASSIRVLACVNMEWLHSVRTVIPELRRGFLDGDFHVGCLAPEVLNDGQAELRLQRVLCMRCGNT